MSISFEQWWASREQQKALELAEKFGSIKQAFEAWQGAEEIKLLARVLHPEQLVRQIEMRGSSRVSETDGLPYYSTDRESYSTVRYGEVWYFHASTLKEGDTVKYDGRLWEVLMNYHSRGSAGTLAYQCIWLLEIGVDLDTTI
jgi:hypothetical protein